LGLIVDTDLSGKWGWPLDDRLAEYEALYGEQPSESWWGWKTYNTSFFNVSNAL